MDADITAAADSLALQKIQAQDYRNANVAHAQNNIAERTETAMRHTEAMNHAKAVEQAAAAWRAENLALSARQVAVAERQEALLSTPSQEKWMELYRMHLTIRLGPAIISSTTPSAVILDMVNDATDMTMTAWPRVKAELDKLAAPQGN